MSPLQLATVLPTLPADTEAARATLVPLRRDVWVEPATDRVQFHIEADAEPESLARLMNFFAQQLLLPQTVSMTQQNGALFLDIEQHAISAHRAEVIAQKMRSLVCVVDVSLQVLRAS
jgi:hypothetical protein